MKYFTKQAKVELSDDWKNLKYIGEHKYYIIGPGREIGVPTWQLLKHDLSKFSPAEWEPYSQFWFGSKGVTGTKDPAVHAAFLRAIKHHYANNPHHYQNPKHDQLKYKLEEVVDWYASAKAQSPKPSQFPTFDNWYATHRKAFLGSKRNSLSPQIDSYIKKKIS